MSDKSKNVDNSKIESHGSISQSADSILEAHIQFTAVTNKTFLRQKIRRKIALNIKKDYKKF